MNTCTQKQQIMKALRNGETLSPLDALNRFGCFKLSTRIGEIERENHDIYIVRGWLETETGKRVRTYRLWIGD